MAVLLLYYSIAAQSPCGHERSAQGYKADHTNRRLGYHRPQPRDLCSVIHTVGMSRQEVEDVDWRACTHEASLW
jgi:hypothetical protein